jgi:alkylation response protein AidB-like acyl-CoA dehydrogenase
MAVQITFDLTNEQDRKIVLELVGRVEFANQIIGAASKVADTLRASQADIQAGRTKDVQEVMESIQATSEDRAAVEAAPDAGAAPVEIDVPMLKRAVLDAHKRVGRRAIELLGEYGGKCEKIEEGKRGEFLERLRGLE